MAGQHPFTLKQYVSKKTQRQTQPQTRAVQGDKLRQRQRHVRNKKGMGQMETWAFWTKIHSMLCSLRSPSSSSELKESMRMTD